MLCKPGDLVILLHADYEPCKIFVGKIHRVSKLSRNFPDSWQFDPPLRLQGKEVSWRDYDMRPIGKPGDDAVDETLLWKPVPSGVTV